MLEHDDESWRASSFDDELDFTQTKDFGEGIRSRLPLSRLSLFAQLDEPVPLPLDFSLCFGSKELGPASSSLQFATYPKAEPPSPFLV
ncbi:hypothetical protein KFK09_019352 [Dendrobium nobile]|uniref:Uncharacterized protein n=1 Tax=Dendrobium nobile TaxID=94219 RepID=A0A8T3APA2_DENNO|nr:hypothetical protein KFK09_019352 [Dendrobium nobile]